jgi:CspA family cold shock protein
MTQYSGIRFFLLLAGEFKMGTGRIKWCDFGKGFGFISPEEGGDDLFFYITDVHEQHVNDLDKGKTVAYEVIEGGMVPCVTNISVQQ